MRALTTGDFTAEQHEFWRRWAQRRVEANNRPWLRAARKALDGDMTELRNRVALADAPPVDVVTSS